MSCSGAWRCVLITLGIGLGVLAVETFFSLFFFLTSKEEILLTQTQTFFFFIGKSFDKIRHSGLSQLELLYQQLSVSVCSHFYNTVFLCVNV